MSPPPENAPPTTNKPRVLFVGRSTFDALYRLDSLPNEDTKIYASEMRAAPGGPALNAAVTHALLGGQAVLVSAVGGGQWAAPILNELNRLGVSLVDLAAGTSYETPLCTVLLNSRNGSRTIVNPPISQVALRHLGASWSAGIPASWGPVPPVILYDGFFFEETAALLTACKSAGAAICLDSGSWKPGIEELTGLLTAAICSERFSVPGQSGSPDATLAWFAAKGVPHIAVTRGARSILGWDRGRRFEIGVAQIAAIDTLGAGDVLHGAFCHHFARSREFEPALRWASEIATLSCQSLGVQAWASQAARFEGV
jgi:sugar/nucleoside kinase (ribokinase family)